MIKGIRARGRAGKWVNNDFLSGFVCVSDLDFPCCWIGRNFTALEASSLTGGITMTMMLLGEIKRLLWNTCRLNYITSPSVSSQFTCLWRQPHILRCVVMAAVACCFFGLGCEEVLSALSMLPKAEWMQKKTHQG